MNEWCFRRSFQFPVVMPAWKQKRENLNNFLKSPLSAEKQSCSKRKRKICNLSYPDSEVSDLIPKPQQIRRRKFSSVNDIYTKNPFPLNYFNPVSANARAWRYAQRAGTLAHGIVAADRCWPCYKYMEVVSTFNVSINWERFIVFVL